MAVSDDLAASKRDSAAKAKDSKRLVPASPPAHSGTAETQAVAELNTRDPLAAAQDDWTHNRDDRTGTTGGGGGGGARGGGRAKRSSDIESVRQELLMRRGESQKGRRRPGETLPPLALGEGAPGVQLTQASPRMATFDEEAETGMGGPLARWHVPAPAVRYWCRPDRAAAAAAAAAAAVLHLPAADAVAARLVWG